MKKAVEDKDEMKKVRKRGEKKDVRLAEEEGTEIKHQLSSLN